MSEIRISLDEVSQAAAKLRALNSSMYENLNQMRVQMDLLDGSWVSNGSEQIRMRFHQFANRFESERKRIEEYAKYLDLTVESYESLESAITSNASGIQY